MPVSILESIACGETMPHLRQIRFNLGNLFSTSDRPDSKHLGVFEQLFDRLREREMHGFQSVSEGTKGPEILALQRNVLCLNHVHIGSALRSPHAMRFSDLKLDRPLIYSLYHNFLNNRLHVFWRSFIHTTDYLDVFATFGRLKPPLNATQADLLLPKTYGFRQFARQFPHVRHVTIDNRTAKKAINVTLFLSFLKELQGLTVLILFETKFDEFSFYHHLQNSDGLKTLAVLRVFEEIDKFRMEIDFRFLGSFPYLRDFGTNLVRVDKVLGLIRIIKVGALFSFDFMHPHLGLEYNQVNVVRTDCSRFVVSLVELRRQNPDFSLQHAQVVFDSGSDYEDSLATVLDYIKNQDLIPTCHWLDDFPFARSLQPDTIELEDSD